LLRGVLVGGPITQIGTRLHARGKKKNSVGLGGENLEVQMVYRNGAIAGLGGGGGRQGKDLNLVSKDLVKGGSS